MSFLKHSDEILTISEFSFRFKNMVKISVPELWLRGEISNLKTYSSGHTYFTLKDDGGAISAVLFKGYSQSMKLSLAEGMRVLAYGEISVYEARGTYQIVVKAMMPDGQGALSLRFEALKKKLSEEGLFAQAGKKQIPPLPKKIGVVTSETGAAIRDFLSILRRRNWSGEVIILPSKVQGAEAAEEISAQIKAAQNMDIDLLVLMRGGGSLEDLWPFNEEIVARCVAASQKPTISAVGHEIDFTLSDFAADLRAETPSAAAEFISSKFLQIKDELNNLSNSLDEGVKIFISNIEKNLSAAEQLFLHSSPKDKIRNLILGLDESEGRLENLLSEQFHQKREILSLANSEFKTVSPLVKINLLASNLDSLEKQLELLSVDSVLKRGFAMALSGDGKILTSAKKLPEKFTLKFHDGQVDTRLDK